MVAVFVKDKEHVSGFGKGTENQINVDPNTRK
jgi:hypothetical protein